jgi:predicted kinase
MTWNELSRGSLGEIVAWANDQPWCQSMAACQQDAGWHSEGDVWTHTQMVCAQLPELAEWPTLTPKEQTVLIFTALFHDSGKAETSRVDPATGRTHSPKHAIRSEHIARRVLRDLGCDLTTREQIARLVRFHGRPAFLLEKPEPSHEVVSLSWLVNNRLLFLFAIADTRGRDTQETTRPEENLHYWKLVAEENRCFEQPFPFANDQARFQFYRQPKPDLHYIPHESYRCTVTLMSGLPGSGKDTWLSRHGQEQPVVSLDEIRTELEIEVTENQGSVAREARERCRALLRARQSFAFNATNLLRQTRQRWTNLFADYGSRIEIVYLEPPFATLLDQNKRRPHCVPEKIIRELADKLEPPTWAEAHGLITVEP